jgi:hypothetical protein
VTIEDITRECEPDFATWLQDRRNSKTVSHRMSDCGYAPVRNPDAKDGLWPIRKRRQVIYGRRDDSTRDLIEAAQRRAAGFGR